MNPYHAIGGQGQMVPRDKFPHYYPSAFGKSAPDASLLDPPLRTDGAGFHYDLEMEGTEEDYYAQSRVFWSKVLKDDKKALLIENLATSLAAVIDDGVVQRILGHLRKVDANLSSSVKAALASRLAGKEKTVRTNDFGRPGTYR